MMLKLQVKNLRFRIDQEEILKQISFDIEKGAFVGIIGPNGSGKSTLLKNIYRVYKPSSGKILLDARALCQIKEKECAQKIAVLAQEEGTYFDFTVEQMVRMGRYPYKSIFENYTKEDLKITNQMLRKVGLENKKDRSFSKLSGGEKQRVLIARALVQNTDFLVLDEPTNHLDIGYQIQLMDLVKSLNMTTLAAMHDMNLAAMYCDYLMVMQKGELIKVGSVKEVLTVELLKEVFGVSAYIGTNPINEKIQVAFMSSTEMV